MEIAYDEVGKVDLSMIYDQPDPVQYFSTLAKLDYRVPQEAKGPFSRLIEARRSAEGREAIRVVDVGCSYGVNAALLKHDLTIEQLTEHYAGAAPDLSREQLLARDQSFFGDAEDEALAVVGIDVAGEAVRYAVDTGVLDAGIAIDLERDELSAPDVERLAGTDLVISTGCYGYVTERTFEQILGTCADNRPWLANMVLRMFDFSPAESLLQDMGYVTEKVSGPVPQRRFASREERRHVLDNLAQEGIDSCDYEETGWYFAELYVSRPMAVVQEAPLGPPRP